MDEEHWGRIRDFPGYIVSTHGNIFNMVADHMMRTSFNNYGHMKITLTDFETGERYSRSVRRIVADTHIQQPNGLCTDVVVLDGDLSNMRIDNLAWRPRWFVWKYTHQLKEDHPDYFLNLRVRNLDTGVIHESILDAAKSEGLLMRDVWLSCHTGNPIYPFGHRWEIL